MPKNKDKYYIGKGYDFWMYTVTFILIVWTIALLTT